MIDFILSSSNLPFTISIGLVICLGLIEGIIAFMGVGLSSSVDSMLSDYFDLDLDANLSLDTDIDGLDGFFPDVLCWLNFGKVPFLVILVIFLFGFGLSGFILQNISLSFAGHLLSGWIASIPSFGCSILLVKFGGSAIAKFVPKEETEAVSIESFIGKPAIIVTGTAKYGNPAQAKLKDTYGKTHYILVQPEKEGEIFETGTEVLIIMRNKHIFYAISNPDSGLLDKVL
ncbi:MAG: YqiJ family protein [Desulfobacterales bacterium]|nr:YqiJ family protein [Desulfobacterales bacterium]